VSDSVCATHWLPYYRCFVGAGVEERAALRILSCARSTHYLHHLSLGTPLDVSGTGLLSVPILIDHPAVPAMQADVRLFSQGLLIEKADSSRVPVLVSLACHVQCVWVLDAAECAVQASRRRESVSGSASSEAEKAAAEQVEQAMAGLFVVFQLKSDLSGVLGDRDNLDSGGGVAALQPSRPAAALLHTSSLAVESDRGQVPRTVRAKRNPLRVFRSECGILQLEECHAGP